MNNLVSIIKKINKSRSLLSIIKFYYTLDKKSLI